MVDLMASRVEKQLKSKDMALQLTDSAKALLAKKGYDPVLGARPLRRTIQREIEDALSEKILFGELTPGQIVVVDTVPEDLMVKDGPRKFSCRGEAKADVLVPDEPPAATVILEKPAS